jgi:hypothetical protein
MARTAAAKTPAQREHAARKLLERYGVGDSTIGDRWVTTAAFGNDTVMVPSPDDKSDHVVWATKKATLNDVAAGLVQRGLAKGQKPTDEQVAASLAQLREAGGGLDDEALLAQLQAQQNVSSQARFQRMESVERLMDRMKKDEAMRAELGPYFGFSPSPDPAPIGKPPEAPPQSPAANPEASPAVKGEADDWWSASAEELRNIPVLGGMPRWGLAATGLGTAAAAGLAYHLMAKGQQQADPVAYASTVQAMNAY